MKAQSIYFSSPNKFNDPYDCAITAAMNPLSEDDFLSIKKYLVSSNNVPENVKNEVEIYPIKEVSELLRKIAFDSIQKQKEEFLSTKGVACFSEKMDDLLMWSHYGGRYKGFCLEFDTQYEPFNMVRNIKYTDVMPKIDPLPCIIDNNFDQFWDLFCTKSSSWSYEKEWRAFHQQAGTLFTYPEKSLTGVYFGPDIEIESLEIISLILFGQNPHVKLYRGKRSADLFQVIFEQFNYIPHIFTKLNSI